MRAIIDRVEEGIAVLLFDDGGRAYVGVDRLPPGVGEGTVLEVSWTVADGGGAEIAELIERLRRRTEEHFP